MTEVSDEFKNQALFDLNMEGKLTILKIFLFRKNEYGLREFEVYV